MWFNAKDMNRIVEEEAIELQDHWLFKRQCTVQYRTGTLLYLTVPRCTIRYRAGTIPYRTILYLAVRYRIVP